MAILPLSVRQYHMFLASPGDVNDERQMVCQFFERYNRQTAQAWGVRFEVVDWENYATIGAGRLQELITSQTELYPWQDPRELITSAHAARAAQKLNLDVDEVRRQYEEIAARLQIDLNFEWHKRNR
jgi:hypothetical protein